jgi:hypothetical protein
VNRCRHAVGAHRAIMFRNISSLYLIRTRLNQFQRRHPKREERDIERKEGEERKEGLKGKMLSVRTILRHGWTEKRAAVERCESVSLFKNARGLTSFQCCVFIITSHHLRRCFVFYGGHPSKSSNVFTRFFIESVATSSPTIHPSVYISMVHHDNIYVFSFSIGYLCVGMYYLVYVRMYVYTWRSVIFSVCRMKTLTTLSSVGQRKYGYFEWEK